MLHKTSVSSIARFGTPDTDRVITDRSTGQSKGFGFVEFSTAEEAKAANLITEIHDPAELLEAAHSLASRIGRQDPLAVRITKSVFHAPAEAHPLIDQLAQGILFESQAKFDRMQAFLDRNAAKKAAASANPADGK